MFNSNDHVGAAILNYMDVEDQYCKMRWNLSFREKVAAKEFESSIVFPESPGFHINEFYKLHQVLGSGSYGDTYLCSDIETGHLYACKSIAKENLNSQELVDNVRREVHILERLRHQPHIVTIYDVFEEEEKIHVIMELCSGGELFEFMVGRGPSSEAEAAQIMGSIVTSIEACHSKGVIHRDLKPENILLVNKNDPVEIKLIDFGMSAMFSDDSNTFGDMVGTPAYIAPEVFRGQHGREVDIWSAGVVLYMLLSGSWPFEGNTNEEIYANIQKGRLDMTSNVWQNISTGAKDLINGMLTRSPKWRPSASEVLSHPWMRQYCVRGAL